MALFYGALYFVGMICYIMFSVEVIQGRLTRRSTWKDMTTNQWAFFVGTLLIPASLIGLAFGS